MRVLVAIVALFAVTGCNDYYFKLVVPENIKEQEIIVPAAKPIPADIVFVVDNSCSMEDEQQNLAANFSEFITVLSQTADADYRIAIVSTDVSSGGRERAGNRVSTFKSAEPFSLLGIDDAGCTETTIAHGCFRGPDPAMRVITSSLAPDQQVAAFQQNVLLGSCGDGANEAGLAAVKLALENGGPNGCNAGFLRPEANLVVVFVSDENDIDPNGTAIANYVNDLKRIKGNSASKLRVAAIVGSVDGDGGNCSPSGAQCGQQCGSMPAQGSGNTGCRANPSTCADGEYCDTSNGNDACQNRDLQFWQFCHWCSYYNAPDCCSALNGSRYVEFAKQMEAEVVAVNSAIERTSCQPSEDKRVACLIDSVCQTNFSETLKKIARDLINPSEYRVSPKACNPEGLVVRINGVELKFGDDYTVTNLEDQDISVVSLTTKPGPDDQVQMFYVIEGCGETQ